MSADTAADHRLLAKIVELLDSAEQEVPLAARPSARIVMTPQLMREVELFGSVLRLAEQLNTLDEEVSRIRNSALRRKARDEGTATVAKILSRLFRMKRLPITSATAAALAQEAFKHVGKYPTDIASAVFHVAGLPKYRRMVGARAAWADGRAQLTSREVSDFEFVRYLLAVARIPEQDLADATLPVLRLRARRPAKRLGDRRRTGAPLRGAAGHRRDGRGVVPRYPVYANSDPDTDLTVSSPDREE